MIIVRLLGGTKKSFLTDKIEVKADFMTISSLMHHLEESRQKHLPPFDPQNILVAVNGIDSSALQGRETTLKDGDIVSIIPLVHGGGTHRTQFAIMNNSVELMRLTKKLEDPIKFLEGLRKKYPELIIQGINARYILNKEHAKKIVAVSIFAQKTDTLLSNRMETDILMRFACTRQINDAIVTVGMKKDRDIQLIIIGKKLSINKLFDEIKHYLKTGMFSQDNSTFIKDKYGIKKKELNCIISKNKLEDLLVEKAATLLN